MCDEGPVLPSVYSVLIRCISYDHGFKFMVNCTYPEPLGSLACDKRRENYDQMMTWGSLGLIAPEMCVCVLPGSLEMIPLEPCVPLRWDLLVHFVPVKMVKSHLTKSEATSARWCHFGHIWCDSSTYTCVMRAPSCPPCTQC